MTGAADLDAHGRWYDSPEYGAVWFPQAVAADWAPYRHGRWMWVAPWGWTWVGDEPWGFAPFHYGRWVFHGGAWGWVPGKRVARPVYAPALVAWVGSPGASVSVQVGARPAVGWFPLAPREVYVPPYRSSAKYVRAVNVSHVTQINNITTITSNPQAAVERMPYAHRQMPRAVTMVPADVVTQQRPIDRAAMLPRDGKSLGPQSVQVQAPVAVPPVEAGRREGRRPMAQDGRERGAVAERKDPSTGGLARQPQPQPQQRPAARPNDVAIGQPQHAPATVAAPAIAPATATAPAAAAAAVPAGAPPRQPGALPAAGSPSSPPAAGQRPDAGQASERARPERAAGRVPLSEPLAGRGEPPRLSPLPGVASPIDRGSPAVPLAPPAVSMPPASQGAASTTAPAERPDRLPAATAGRRPQSAERPVTAVERSVSGAASGRPEEHAKPPAPPVAAPPLSPTLPGFPERPTVAAPVPAPAPRPPQAQPQAQAQPQVQAQRQVQAQPQVQVQPQPQPQPQPQVQPQVQASRPPQAPGLERSASGVEPRRADDVARRGEAFARQQKPEASVDARPAAMPQRSVAPSGDAKSPPPDGRQSRPERPHEAGGQREGRGGGGGRGEQLPRGPDG